MNSTADNIIFDSNGQCNYCKNFMKKINLLKKKNHNLEKLIKKIKSQNKIHKYDCIVGLSGGIDSCYTLVKVVESGLRPLAVHMDNGWNSELAQNNIGNLVRSLNVDLFTYVIDWEEYKKMMKSFFDSDVIDIELLMDNAMLAVNYQQASYHNIKYILAGTNTASEGMAMPPNMNWFKYDKKNILDIISTFGNNQIKTYPIIGTFDLVRFILFKKIKWISFLDYFKYNKFEATKILTEKYNFKPYTYKHYESIFTRFYQGYILPKKFGIDKRILHLSTLIISDQISRNDAIKQLENSDPYPSEEMLKEDKDYFLAKMDWTNENLNEYIKRPEKKHNSYKSEKFIFDNLLKIYKILKF